MPFLIVPQLKEVAAVHSMRQREKSQQRRFVVMVIVKESRFADQET